MMKFLLWMMFMIPLSFTIEFWLFQYMFFMISFIFMINFSFNNLFMNISYFLGEDLLSFMLILLSFWVCSLMILASEKLFKYNNYYKMFMFVMLVLMISLFMTFSSLNLFIFYLFFEISLIPTLILIIGWGYQPERIDAGMYLLFYTLLVSLPMMIVLFYLYIDNGTLEINFLIKDVDNFLFYFCLNSVFFVKIPMFFIHLWLPKAHVEAPVSGSMILAGIMLKLGGYGLLRMMKLFMFIGLSLNLYIIIISLIGGFFVSLICMRQSDMKSLIAYSSVAHMSLVLAGIMTMNLWGFWGAMVLMLAHGLCSSGLFCLANIMYERVSSRSLYLNKGLINIFPSFSLWWFLLCSSNMAAPPSLNLLGEIVLINSLVGYSFYMMVFLSLISFFSAVYSLYLYSFSQHGMFYCGSYSMNMGLLREYLLLFLHWFPLNLLILKSEFMLLWV
uniref:NADH-ubiquinone oxidoreductase chain 4 n=1 Tax=Deporaus marginatus TaxID=1544439 RepID=A0A7G7WQ80_9CUCU|nr:NADH dehydrogenase subunit 4 [Deporaus marginatus]QNH68707.1 NADH dehydrogenase subunit 4 [Deporaus marginatus]